MPHNDTRLKVVSAYDQCLNTMPVDKIRVVEVCRLAGISRTTFYGYFENLEDVPIWLWDYLMDNTLYQAGRRYGCYEAHLRKFQALVDYRRFFLNVFKPTNYQSVTQHGGRVMLTRLREIIQRKSGRELSESESLQLEFFVTGAKHMTRHWVRGGMEEPPERMARVFTDAMPAYALPFLEADPAYDDAEQLRMEDGRL